MANLRAFYGISAPRRFVTLYRQSRGPFRYLGKFWTTQRFSVIVPDTLPAYRPVWQLLLLGMVCQILLGLMVLYEGILGVTTGGVYAGLAILVSYPIVWALVLFGLALVWQLLHPKRYGKALICSVLERQVIKLRARNDFTLIAVAGSVGKTSTKLAIAKLLSGQKRVRYQEGNYNDRLTVPLVLFNVSEPGIYNLPAWLKIFWRNSRKLRTAYPYDVALVELGTDHPGQMSDFAYLHPDLTVLTAVAEEHMAYFGSLQAVADEELDVFDFSTQVLVNVDDVAEIYLQKFSYLSYGTAAGLDYRVKLVGSPTRNGQKLTITAGDKKLTLQSSFLGVQGAKIMLAAVAVAQRMELDWNSLKRAAAGLQPYAGRMQLLTGISSATLIDDTYNASPTAVKAALDVLCAMDARQRIAILGSMNELGDFSSTDHAQVGAYCNPKKIHLVVTVGSEAKQWLAPAAKQVGCKVKSFSDPVRAGNYVKKQLKNRAIVLAKGSQNGVFAEEALKQLLADPADASKLVRQSPYWLSVKRSQLGD